MQETKVNKRRGMPNRREIINYWLPILTRMGLEIDDELARVDQCFICGAYGPKLERAHIKALCNGGSNSVKNLHLLCASCHHESELFEGKKYWLWYRCARKHKPAEVLRSKLAAFSSNRNGDNLRCPES